MTREEAIFQLQDLRSHCKDFSEEGSVWQKDIEALDMAIKALQEWIQEEYNESEIDWSKVAVDTPVLFSWNGVTWFKAHFARFSDGEPWVWSDGKTSFTTDGSVSCFAYTKLAEVEK